MPLVDHATAPSVPSPRDPRTVAAASAYVALAVLDTRLAADPAPSARRWRRVTKPLLMPALGAAFAAATPRDASTLRRGTWAAHALSCAGDVALLGSGQRAFLAGLGSFFGAHISYVTAFGSVRRSHRDRSHLGGVRAAAGALAVLAPSLSWAAGRRDPALRAPVAAYAGVITTMLAAASRMDERVPAGARRTVVLGSATFLASDATIALRKFLLRNPTPRSDAVVMGTYTAGQGLIAHGVASALRASARDPRRS